jgi:predicted permease
MFIKKLKRRLAALFNKEVLDQDLDAELRYHLERDAEQNQRSGMNSDDAHYAALRAFGNVERSREECRDARRMNFFDNLIRDVRYSVRLLIKNPTFSIVAILTLTLGIGANTAIFSLLDAVLLRNLPVNEPDRLVLFGNGLSGGLTDSFPNESTDLFSYSFYHDIRQHQEVFKEVGAVLSITWTVHGRFETHDAEPQRLEVQLVSGSYFKVLGVNARLGRLITDEDDRVVGMHPVAVVTHALWQRMGGDQQVIGKTIQIDETAYTIIGVGPKGFSGTTVGVAPDIWIPLAMEPQLPPAHWNGRNEKDAQSLYVIGRLQDGVNKEQANASVNVFFQRFLQDLAGPQPSAESVQDMQRAFVELTPAGKGVNGVRQDFALPLKILMVVVGVVLLISCANIANLLLARGAVRKKEIALRLALGARRLSLVRQLITESLILAGVAGVAGFAVAWWGTGLLVAMASNGPRPLPLDITPNLRVLGFTLLASVAAAIVFGATPAFSATRVDLNTSLKEGKGAVGANSQNRLGRILVVAQVALTVVLMVGAGLFVRTLVNLQNIPTGFNETNVTLLQIDTATTGLKDAQIGNLLIEAEDRVRRLPGVEAASFSFLTFNQGGWTSTIYTFDETPPKGESNLVRQNTVSVDYFKAMGIPIVSGRVFETRDTDTSQKVAVVSETMARHYYPSGDALGKHFGKSSDKRDEIEIVGIVKDAKYQSLTENSRSMVYFALKQRPGPVVNFIIRVSPDAQNVIPAVRRTLAELNSNLPIDDIVSLQDHVSRSLVQQKLVARLASFFGLLALMLASIGLYGVLSYSVARRRNEIGIRRALGASALDVMKMVLRSGLILTLIGVVLGVLGALALTRLANSLLFGVTPTDLTTFLAVGFMLLGVAFIACYIPARRATRVDPLIALRYE